MNHALQLALDRAETIRTRYRACLLKLGKSPDYHIYDLTYAFLATAKPTVYARALAKLKHFYDDLDVEDKPIFVNEVLEKNRHYPFWFMGEGYRRNEFETRREELLLRLPRGVL